MFLIDGKATKKTKNTTVRSTTLNTPYDFSIIPFILTYSSTVTSQGGLIKITGTGFSSKKLTTTVDFFDTPCKIISIDSSSISCILPPLFTIPIIDSTLRYVAGSGVKLEIIEGIISNIDYLISDYRVTKTLQIKQTIVIAETELNG